MSVDNFEPIEFSNKTSLALDSPGGNDTIIVNNPNTPTGLTALTANGGLGNNTLIVNANNQAVLSSGITATTVTIPGALPAFGLGYTSFGQVRVINAQDALTAIPVPALTAAAGVPVSLTNALVAAFKFSDPVPPTIFGSAADFVASIDWGDGSIATGGTIVANGTNGFQVFGSHTYLTAGSFAINVTVTDAGSTRQFTPAGGVPVEILDNTGATTMPTAMTVTAVAINLTAQLNPASDSGKFDNDAITDVNQPNFFGTSEPFSTVRLFAAPTGGGAPAQIGQTEAGSDGSWSITSNHLADGSYQVTASSLDEFGTPTTAGLIRVLPGATRPRTR